MHTINDYGWDSRWEAEFEPYARRGLVPVRVTAVYRERFELMTPGGPSWGRLSGALRGRLLGAPPAVGDMAAVAVPLEQGDASIEDLLPRRTELTRQSVHNVHERQAMAANVDLVCVATGLDANFSVARIERYLTVAWNSGARPAILLTKTDLCDAAEERLAEVESAAPGVPAVALCAPGGRGLEEFLSLWRAGETTVILGSSGVGKSTLLNAVMGREVMRTREIRADDGRGRHTTTSRQMFLLPGGRLFIDTPGMREIAFDAEGGARAFSDIEALSRNCRFADCLHLSEPGCAVLEAIAAGNMAADRLERYRKFQREERHKLAKTDRKARLEQRERDRAFGRMVRQMTKKF